MLRINTAEMGSIALEPQILESLKELGIDFQILEEC